MTIQLAHSTSSSDGENKSRTIDRYEAGPDTRFLDGLERDLIARHFVDLGEESRYLRFGRQMSTPNIQSYVERINFSRDTLIGSFRGEALVGLAQICGFVRAGRRHAEGSISVLPLVQRRGLGGRLLRVAVDYARERRLAALHFETCPSNRAVRGLVRSSGLHLTEIENEGMVVEVHAEELGPAISYSMLDGVGMYRMKSPKSPQARHAMLIHGAGGDAWQWLHRIMPALAARGISSHSVQLPQPAHTYDSASLFEQTSGTLRVSYETLEKPEIIVGHSLGGYFATQLAEEVGDQCKSLILLAPVPGVDVSGPSGGMLGNISQALRCTNARSHLVDALAGAPGLDAAGLRCDISIIAGRHDKVVPPHWLKALSRIYQARRFDEIDVGHNVFDSPEVAHLVARIDTGSLERRSLG